MCHTQLGEFLISPWDPLTNPEVGDRQAPGWAAATGLLGLLRDGIPAGPLRPDWVHSCGFPSWHMCREAPQSRGRMKGGRRRQLESTLAERCMRTSGPNMETIGQRQPRKLPPCKQPKLPLWHVSHYESARVLFHTYFAYSKYFHLFHNLVLFAEFFLQRR